MQPQQPQQGFPMVPMMQPNMQGIVGMNFGAQLPPGAMQMQVCVLSCPCVGVLHCGNHSVFQPMIAK